MATFINSISQLGFQFHDTLNPKLWEETDQGYTLKDDVREALVEIANAFVAYIDLPTPLPISDIYLLGSNAGYNYTKYSDIDLHLSVNFSLFNASEEIMQLVFNLKKNAFNSSHDITVKGINVELYVEDVKAGTNSNGIYSVMTNQWIKYPIKDDFTSVVEIDKNIDFESLNKQLRDTVIQYNQVIKSDDFDEVTHFIEKVYNDRKNGLLASGEFSNGNLIFKFMRNKGYLEKLRLLRDNLLSKELTLEGYIRDLFNR